jgi:hypothetical protein
MTWREQFVGLKSENKSASDGKSLSQQGRLTTTKNAGTTTGTDHVRRRQAIIAKSACVIRIET